MCSLEKLKELAVSQMHAAADLYGKAEKEMKEDDTYNKLYLWAQCYYRHQLLNHLQRTETVLRHGLFLFLAAKQYAGDENL